MCTLGTPLSRSYSLSLLALIYKVLPLLHTSSFLHVFTTHLKSTAMASTQQVPSMAKVSEPNRNKKYDPKKPHITEEAITSANWYKHVNWLNVTLIIGVPIYGMIQAYWTPLQWKTAVFAFVYYFLTGLGITAG
jgi:hypothetical protein